MEELFLLSIIPIVLIQTINGQGVQFSKGSDVFPLSGDRFENTCSLTEETPSASGAQFQWYDKEGNEVTNTSSFAHLSVRMVANGKRLNWDKVNQDDSGSYRCKATVDEKVYEKSYSLIVKETIEFNDCELEQYGILGQPGSVKCKATLGGPGLSTEWDKNGIQVINDAENGIMIDSKVGIVLLKVGMSDQSIYTFTARTSKRAKTKQINYKVLTQPKITKPILEQTAVVGNSATLFCTATGNPIPELNWFAENSKNVLRTGGRITIIKTTNDGEESIQSSLKFDPVEKEDEKKYWCNATSLAGVAHTSNRLIVHTPPTIDVIEPNPAEGKAGQNMNIKCVVSGDPLPNVIWGRDDTSVQYTDTGADGITTITGITTQTQTELTLSISELKEEHAGMYKCTATNMADTVSKTVELIVSFKPSFITTQTEPFYNWAGRKDGAIVCVAHSNPEPKFEWFKGDTKINPNDTTTVYSYRTVSDPEDKYKFTNTLRVKYTGSNEDIFGGYTCKAENFMGPSEQTLQMVKGQTPGAPQVSIQKQMATEFEFWFDETTVLNGPEILQYKIEYKVKGSSDKLQSITKEKENRDHIDPSRRYTVAVIRPLIAKTEYAFTFYAINAVGEGTPFQMMYSTPEIRVPEAVEILTESNSKYSTRIEVRWNVPSDGGGQITSYKLTYREVQVKKNKTVSLDSSKGYEYLSGGKPVAVENIVPTYYRLEDLRPGKFYEIKVYAINIKGESLPGTKIIRTNEGEQGGLSTGAIIGIVVAIFFILFIIVDVTCYFRNNCGILMSIKEKFGGSRGDEGYSAAKTEDVENLAKKDELTEEAKAAEEGDAIEAGEDEKKEPLLSEEQKVDTVDETDAKKDVKEMEPDEKEAINSTDTPKPAETPAPAEAPKVDSPATPATEEQPASDTAKPQE